MTSRRSHEEGTNQGEKNLRRSNGGCEGETAFYVIKFAKN